MFDNEIRENYGFKWATIRRFRHLPGAMCIRQAPVVVDNLGVHTPESWLCGTASCGGALAFDPISNARTSDHDGLGPAKH